ncbi:tetratricopeptide repeat protein [Fluviicola sp.]|jgi:tetratricopeptide (TPR) repeat protein|uniref:tetratricopeptide repeat protein n=1 Tax=Fluviicola sp. TaxID=1917219 RepID=UPI00281F7E46|nr:tetratricopeptide repeat protein [Fluviicola sp.]MDR0803181.1 tetratricopeptide repeat protein [Fluviicola sp.]
MRSWILVSILFVFSLVQGQTPYLDSLKLALQKPVSSDTMRVFQCNEIARAYLDYSLDSTYFYLQKGLDLARRKKYPNGIMSAKNTLGIYYRLNSQYADAIRTYEELIGLCGKYHQENRLVDIYSNLGSVYLGKGNYAQALKNYREAIDIAKKIRGYENVLVLYTDLGVAYKISGLYDQAVKVFREGLGLNKQIKDEEQEGRLYLNIATVYHERQMYDLSIKYHLIAREIMEKLHKYRSLEMVLYNLTLGYCNVGQLGKARNMLDELREVAVKLDEDDIWGSYYYAEANYLLDTGQYAKALQAADMAEKMSNQEADLLNYGEIQLTKAAICEATGKIVLAIRYAKLALEAFRDTKDLNAQVRAYQSLSGMLRKAGDHKKALEYFEMASELKEKMDLESVTNQIETLNSLNELDRKEQDLALSKQTNQRISAENKQKSNLIFGLFLTGGLIMISLGISFKSNQDKKKANALLNQRNEEIERQKSLIEAKQVEIRDSIRYAKRVQELLPVQKRLLREVFPESFIFFQPKNIVSGDFYWIARKNGKFYLAICDSTGHDIPGAFMSTLNMALLDEAINRLGIEEPGQVFNHVRNRLLEFISDDGMQDGMDGVLFCFDERASILTYAAAYNSPVVVRSGELIEFPADKMPVGKSGAMESFRTYSIEIRTGDTLFAYTDGYANQPGGEKGKKLERANLNVYLRELTKERVSDQEQLLETHFTEWKGNLDQVDDVCVFGVKLI